MGKHFCLYCNPGILFLKFYSTQGILPIFLSEALKKFVTDFILNLEKKGQN